MPELSSLAPVSLPGAPLAQVTLGLLDGRTRTGQITTFAPEASEIALDVGERTKELVPAAGVAYVAFHESTGEAPLSPESGAEPYRIHLVGGTTFAVHARPSRGSRYGFRAVPREKQSAYAEFYFYSHGVRAREKDLPLGVMLVKSGAIHPDALEHAVVAQRKEREVPIGQILVDTLQIAEADVARTITLQKTTNQRIGELLIHQGLATTKQIEEALAEQRRRRSRRLGETLLDLNIVSEETLGRTLARKFDLTFVDLDASPPDPDAVALLPREVIERTGILPIKRTSKSVLVAIADPLACDGLDEVRSLVDLPVEEVIATPSALKRCIDLVFERTPSLVVEADQFEFEGILQGIAHAPPPRVIEPPSQAPISLPAPEPETPVTLEPPSQDPLENAVRTLLRDALQRGASHVHLEPLGVRLRIDGRRVTTEHRYGAAVANRFKALADLDPSERVLPQRGKASFRLADRSVELLVDTIPTFDGSESIVLQLLRPLELRQLSDLGLSEANRRKVGALVEKPGLLLVAGPSGSGKTTTLHALVHALDTPDVRICIAEDRIEITHPGVCQVEVKPRSELTFAHAIRAFARSDADVIVAGDLRDPDTARAAIQSAQQGKRMFSALPTKTAAETVLRLIDLGTDPFELADCLTGVLAQRLVKQLCPSCKKKRAIGADELAVTAESYGLEPFPRGTELWSAAGCATCNGTGYQGYVALQELMATSDELKRAIARRAPAGEIEKAARAARVASLTEDGVQKVMGGVTDLRQVMAGR